MVGRLDPVLSVTTRQTGLPSGAVLERLSEAFTSNRPKALPADAVEPRATVPLASSTGIGSARSRLDVPPWIVRRAALMPVASYSASC